MQQAVTALAVLAKDIDSDVCNTAFDAMAPAAAAARGAELVLQAVTGLTELAKDSDWRARKAACGHLATGAAATGDAEPVQQFLSIPQHGGSSRAVAI